MAGTITVPGAGPVKKGYVYAGAAGAGVLVIIWYRSRKTAAAPAGASGAAAGLYPPDGTSGDPTDPYSTDPATGQTYGNEASGSYGTGSYGGAAGGGGGSATDPFPWDGTTGNPSDPNSMDPQSGSTYGDEGSISGTGTGTTGPPFGTNAQWSQYALAQLTANSGLDAGKVTTALGAYINGQSVDAAEETIINDAIAVAGPVPVTGAGGYPPSIRVSGTKTGGATKAHNPVKNLHASARYTNITVTWKAASGAGSYEARIYDGGRLIDKQDVTSPSAEFGKLRENTSYRIQVWAKPGTGPQASTTAKTLAAPKTPARK